MSSSDSVEDFSELSLEYGDISKLKPYDFEPLATSSDSESEEQENVGVPSASDRTGNINWCQCGECKPMNNEVESLCCVEAPEIIDEFFEGTCLCQLFSLLLL